MRKGELITEVDKKNNKIILDVLSRFSLADESLNYVKNIFDSPNIDPVYGKHLGPDLRKKWPLDYKMLQAIGIIKNEGFSQFKDVFIYYVQKGAVDFGYPTIDEIAFSDNKVLWKKNTIKLKKILVDYYNTYRDDLYEQWERSREKLDLPEKVKSAFVDDATLAEQYVLKANEYIGRFKISEKESTTELVMSNNPADWLMCSTNEQWTSCLSLESTHGYWAGIPFILDDKNRTMFYISSNKRRKSYMGIEVDGMNNRTWGLLDSKDAIRTIRWFPESFLNLEAMKNITGLDLKDTKNYDKSKYTILSKIHFSDGVAQTPYLDNIGVKIAKDGKVEYECNGRIGVNAVNVLKPEEPPRSHFTRLGFEAFVKSQRPWFKFLYSKICGGCNADIPYADPFLYGGRYYCTSCLKTLFYNCSVCGNSHLKEDAEAPLKTPKNEDICPSCFTRYYVECKACGETEKKDKCKSGFCPTCISTSDKVVKCQYEDCETYFLKKGGVRHYSDELGEIITCGDKCSSDLRKDLIKDKKIKFFSCPHCNSWHDERDGVLQFNGDLWCRKDVFKISDKKQMKFVFKMTA